MRTLLLLAMANMLLSTSTFAATAANNPPHVTRYIDSYYEIAIREMHRSGIPASVTLAQGIHESSWGLGELSTNSNNHFGIKCKSSWAGPTYYIEDDDIRNGVLVKSCFRVYNSVEESYVDHTNFLIQGDRYNKLFDFDRTDYINWAKGLKDCGYATDKKYDVKLIRTIEKYNLTQYDQANPPVVSAPVFHFPAPEPMPQTAAPQEATTDLMVSSTVTRILKPNTNNNNTTTETVVAAVIEEETPPAPVNIENYDRNSNTFTTAQSSVEESSASFENHEAIDETETEVVVIQNIQPISYEVEEEEKIETTNEIHSSPQYQMAPLPRTEKPKPELPTVPEKIGVTKADDSHLQVMKGKMRVARKPRR